jgi:hypothetical protein
MRKSLFLAAALVVSTSVAFGDDFEGKTAAMRTATQVEWNWDGGTYAAIGVPVTVHYQASGSPRIIVKGPADLVERVRFQDGELRLKERLFNNWNWNKNGERLDVTLVGMKLTKIGVAGKVDMDMGEIHQSELALSIAGSGSFQARGNADDLRLRVAGSGDYHLDKLAARDVQVQIAGSGRIEAASPQSARIKIVGSGQVHFVAMPKDIDTNIVGSGQISDASGQVIDKHFGSDRYRRKG